MLWTQIKLRTASTLVALVHQLCYCNRRASVIEQTTSNNNPVIWHSSEFQEPTESSLFLINRFLFSIHLERGALKTKSWSGHSSSLEKLLKDGVEALNCNRYALEKKAGLSVVSWNRRYLTAQLRKESDGWLIQVAKRLCCDRLKQATCLYQKVVFGCFSTVRLFSCCTVWARVNYYYFYIGYKWHYKCVYFCCMF